MASESGFGLQNWREMYVSSYFLPKERVRVTFVSGSWKASEIQQVRLLGLFRSVRKDDG